VRACFIVSRSCFWRRMADSRERFAFWRVRDSEVDGLGLMKEGTEAWCLSGVGLDIGSFSVVGESLTSFTGAVLRGEALGGLAFGLKGVRMGDLKGLLTDAFRRRRFAGVSITQD
jgi:hypothetical protein